MLRIILGILRLIGILLVAILLLIVGILLIILITPVRYRGTVEKTADRTRADVRVSWLFHFLSVAFSFDLHEKQRELTINIFGIRLNSILAVIRKISAGLQHIRSRKKRMEAEEKTVMSDDSERIDVALDSDEMEDADAEPVPSETVELVETVETEKRSDTEGDAELEDDSGQQSEDVRKTKRKNTAKKKNSEKAKEEQKSLEERLEAVSESLYARVQSIARLPDKIEEMQNKVSDYLNIAEEYEVKAVVGQIFHKLFYLLKKYLPRKMTGYVHFGMSDPSLTGKITGLLYVIRPAGASAFRIEPEFAQTIFETEVTFTGRIRPCHVLITALRILMNKKLIRLIKKILSLRKQNKR